MKTKNKKTTTIPKTIDASTIRDMVRSGLQRLVEKYPDWSPAEITVLILTLGDPLSETIC